MRRSSVDLPEPEPPRITSVCPSITSRQILSSTVCLPNRLVTSRTCMAALGIITHKTHTNADSADDADLRRSDRILIYLRDLRHLRSTLSLSPAHEIKG